MNNVSEAFKSKKYVYLSNVISDSQAELLSDHLFELYADNKTDKDPQCPLSDSIYNAPMLDELLHNLCAPLSKQLGIELDPAYCYARIYRHGEVLEPHTDRPACEISGTLTLGHHPDSKVWPIWMGKDKTDDIGTAINIEVGDMVMYHGCELNHWRPEYKGEWQTQVFFHYVDKNGYNREHAGDKINTPKSSITSLNRSDTVPEPQPEPEQTDSIRAPELQYRSGFVWNISHHDNVFPGIATVYDTERGMGFTPTECERIIDTATGGYANKATIGAGSDSALNEEIRKVDEYQIDMNADNAWIFDRIGHAVSRVNAELYKFDLTGIIHGLSLLHYKGSDHSHYTWHTDTGDGASSTRKISISIPLSKPEDYQGGDLIVNSNGTENIAHKTQGSLTMFPSFCMHTVTPVTAGERWVIVVWVNGPRFK